MVDEGRDWAPLAHRGDYRGIVWYREGDEGTPEALAKSLSAQHKGEFFVLYLDPEELVTLAFHAGTGPTLLDRHPYHHAADLGCQIGDTREKVQLNQSVCVVPEASVDAVAQVFGLESPPSGGPLHIESTTLGVAVFSDRGGIGGFLDDLCAAFAGPVYCVTADERRFLVEIAEGAERSFFEYPARELRHVRHVSQVRGQCEPRSILSELAVPPVGLRWTGKD